MRLRPIGLAALALCALGACDHQPTAAERLHESADRERLDFPAGRFQMLPAKATEGVYVMDTTDGSIRFCRPQEGTDGMGCGAAAVQ